MRRQRLMIRPAGALAVAVLGGLFFSAVAQATTKTFTFTGAEQTFVVPSGITKIHVDAVGGSGGVGTGAYPRRRIRRQGVGRSAGDS